MTKLMILVLSLTISTFSFAAAGRKLTTAEKSSLLKGVMSDVMLRGALADARKSGTCQGQILSAVDNSPAGVEFEAQINCSSKGDEYTGGGTFLMINVKGRAFGNGLENSVITVQKAG